MNIDELTVNLLSNYKKMKQNKYTMQDSTSEAITSEANLTSDILLHNIEIITDNLSKINRGSLDKLLTTMIHAIRTIIMYQKMNLLPTNISHVETLQSICSIICKQNIQSSSIKNINID